MNKSYINIDKIAAMSKLEFTKKEMETLKEDLLKLEKMNEILNELSPIDYSLGDAARLREDNVEESLERELLIKNSPESVEGFFSVKQIGVEND